MTTIQEMPQPPVTIMRLKQVLACTGLSRSTVYDLLDTKSPRHDPSFPKNIQLTQGCVGWVSTEVYQWIELRIAKSRI